MNIPYKSIKWLTFSIVFLLIVSGRWYDLANRSNWSVLNTMLQSMSYGVLLALVSYFLVDLVLARGMLQLKIVFIKIILFYLLILIIFNQLLVYKQLNIQAFIFIECSITLILSLTLLVFDARQKAHPDFIVRSKVGAIPAEYFTAHPIKTFFETIFRLFPYPEPVGLYKIGHPTKQSMVFVTVNYEYTIRRVARKLKGKDCWLLVCDSRGINVWCSSLAHHFGTEDIIEAIKLTRLADYLSHRKLILPQLCASNVSLEAIQKETGFAPQFGPVYISEIDSYLKQSGGTDFRKVSFGLKSRLEMALGCPIMLCILLIFIYNFLGPFKLLTIIPTLYFWSLVHASIHPYRPIKSVQLWSLCFGGFVFLVMYFVSASLLKIDYFGSNIAISLGVVYLINEFTGWSPLTKYSFIYHKKAEIFIDSVRCIGCHRCFDVCPKGVFLFGNNKSIVGASEACISCKSCFSQCPVGAILDSANKKR